MASIFERCKTHTWSFSERSGCEGNAGLSSKASHIPWLVVRAGSGRISSVAEFLGSVRVGRDWGVGAGNGVANDRRGVGRPRPAGRTGHGLRGPVSGHPVICEVFKKTSSTSTTVDEFYLFLAKSGVKWELLCSLVGYAILNINFQTFSELFLDLIFPNDIHRSNRGITIENTMKWKIINLIKSIRIKYYQNACQKISSGKLFLFSILKDKKTFSDFSRLENNQTFFHTFPDSAGTLSDSRSTSHKPLVRARERNLSSLENAVSREASATTLHSKRLIVENYIYLPGSHTYVATWPGM